MRTVISNLCRGLIALAFAAALTFGVSQTVSASANRSICDTPPGVCTDDIDCNHACDVYNGTQFGGGCVPGVGCCLCLE